MLCQKIIPKINRKKLLKATIKAINWLTGSSILLVVSTHLIAESKLLELIESVKSLSPYKS